MSSSLALFEKEIEELAEEHVRVFSRAVREHELRELSAQYTGAQGRLTLLFKRMREVAPEERKAFGQRLNQLKATIEAAFEARLVGIQNERRKAELSGAPIDITLPGRSPGVGKLHPITRVTEELLGVFTSMGFEVAEGPEIELHEHNFDKLGFPPDHPATDMQDSFYIESTSAQWGKRLLRTHTSTIQVREMLRRKPPLAIVAPGAVYRRDDDVTHSPMFFQLEGFVVDEGITFAHLKGVLTRFIAHMFGKDVPVRFRPSYFPFVEPGGEVDIGWSGHKNIAQEGSLRWLEILGCGMIHPVVFENVGYDAERYSGFAFGMGIDRIAMLKYGITDIRWLYENDVRFLSQV